MKSLDWKKAEVERLANLADEYPVIGVASIHEIPAKEFQAIRRDMRGQAEIKVAKKTLITRAFEKCESEEVDQLEPRLEGQVALIFTGMNPFKLFRYLEENKVNAPAKPGHVPTEDVWVESGKTSFPPGPIVSELQKVGIPARIERGKVVILEDTLFVEAGEAISKAKADILSRLEINPIRIGLDVKVIYEEGMLFGRSVLDVDREEMKGQLSLAAQQAFNLSFNAGYYTDLTIVPMIQDCYTKARSLSVNARVLTQQTAGEILSMGHQEMLALASVVLNSNPEAVGEDLREFLSSTPPPQEEEQQESEQEEEEEAEAEAEDEAPEEEEEEGAGLGALFA